MSPDALKQGLALLSEAFPKREINPKLFYLALKDLTDDQFLGSILQIVQKTTKLFPDDNLIAMIREKTSGTEQDRAVLAWDEATSAVKKHGFYKTVSFEDAVINAVIESMGGWEAFSNIEAEDVPFRKKDFLELYKAISGSARKLPEKLPGHFERINSVPEKVILIKSQKERLGLGNQGEKNKVLANER